MRIGPFGISELLVMLLAALPWIAGVGLLVFLLWWLPARRRRQRELASREGSRDAS